VAAKLTWSCAKYQGWSFLLRHAHGKNPRRKTCRWPRCGMPVWWLRTSKRIGIPGGYAITRAPDLRGPVCGIQKKNMARTENDTADGRDRGPRCRDHAGSPIRHVSPQRISVVVVTLYCFMLSTPATSNTRPRPRSATSQTRRWTACRPGATFRDSTVFCCM